MFPSTKGWFNSRLLRWIRCHAHAHAELNETSQVIQRELAGTDERLGRADRDSEIDLGDGAEPLDVEQEGAEPVEFDQRSVDESPPRLLRIDDGDVEAVVRVGSAETVRFAGVPHGVGLDVRMRR